MKCSGIHKEQNDNAVTKTHVSLNRGLNIIEAALVISIASNAPVQSNQISGRNQGIRATAFCTRHALIDSNRMSTMTFTNARDFLNVHVCGIV